MSLKKSLFTSVAAVTLLSAGAAIVNQSTTSQVVEAKTVTKQLSRNSYVYKSNGRRASKKTLKKGTKVNVYGYKKIHGKSYANIGKGRYVRTSNLTAVKKAKPEDPNKKMYNQWIKDCKSDKGNLVAIRDTHEYDTSDDYDAKPETDTNIHEGEPYDIGTKDSHDQDEDEDFGIDLEKYKNEYFIEYSAGDGSTAIKASDFTYKPYDEKYSELKSELKKNTKGRKVQVTLSQDVTSWDTNKKLSAGTNVKLKDPAVMIGKDGYYIDCSVGEGDFMVPYSAISQLG